MLASNLEKQLERHPLSPLSTASSLKDSNARPPKGERAVLQVGPRSTAAPLALHSSPRASPMRVMSSTLNEEASPVPQGVTAAGVPLKNCVQVVQLDAK